MFKRVKMRSHFSKRLNRNLLIDLSLLVISILTLFLFVPVFHVKSTPSEFSFLDFSVFMKIVCVFSLLTFVALMIILIALHIMRLKTVSRCFVIFLLSWVTLAGFLFPLVQSNGMIEASETVVNNQYLILVSVLSVIFSLIALSKLFYIPIIFCMVIILASFFPSLPTFLGVCSKPDSLFPARFTEVSTEKNIFVISFDGLPGTVVKNVLEDNPDISETFKDFVFFANAVSQAPATHASIRSELFGNRNYHSIASTNKEVDALLDLDSLLLNNIQDSLTYGPYNSYNLNSENRSPSNIIYISELEKINNHLYWMELLMARIGTLHLNNTLKKVGFFEISTKLMTASNYSDDDLSFKLKNYVGPSGKSRYIRQKDDYNWIVNNLTAGKSGLSLRHMHFVHSHYPVDFDENGIFRGNDALWHQSNQNYQGLYNECIGVTSQFKMLIEKLKTLGIYDKSLIVFKSDHGKPVNYYDAQPNDMKINAHELWGVDRYMPLLMIKGFSRRKSHIEYNNDLVTLPDLAKTLCIAAQSEGVDCSIFPGLNLLGDYKISDSPIFYIETVTSPKSTFEYDTHQTIELKRSKNKFYEILESSRLVKLSSRSQSMLNRRFTTVPRLIE